MTHDAELVFSYPSFATADAIARALAPEADVAEVPKTRAVVSASATEVRILVHAEDLASLRAALNSYLRWIDTAERAARVAG